MRFGSSQSRLFTTIAISLGLHFAWLFWNPTHQPNPSSEAPPIELDWNLAQTPPLSQKKSEAPQILDNRLDSLGLKDLGLAAITPDDLLSTFEGTIGSDDLNSPNASALLSAEHYARLSFVDRINQLIGHHWRRDIDHQLSTLYRTGRRLEQEQSVTTVMVNVDQRGVVKRVFLTASSGTPSLDEAAIQAFRSASPIPNPPRELIRSDGLVPIRWTFIVHEGAAVQANHLQNDSENQKAVR
ncbi:energy transducer TonB [bacterium]|nr:energy transducer TonB [bacterium]